MGIEADLKEVFSRQLATAIQPDSLERLQRANYNPKTPRQSHVRVGALVGMTATGATVASVLLVTGSSPAFAGWTSSPTRVAKSALSDVIACQRALASIPGATSSGWSQVASDVRGPYTLVVYQDSGSTATCLMGPNMTDVSESSGGTQLTVGSATDGGEPGGEVTASNSSVLLAGGSGISQIEESHLSSTGQAPYTVIDGQVASDVSGVSLVLSDGSTVETTTGSGWFVAWWPGSDAATSAEVTTSSGTTTQPFG